MPLGLCQLGYSSTTIALKILGGLCFLTFLWWKNSQEIYIEKNKNKRASAWLHTESDV